MAINTNMRSRKVTANNAGKLVSLLVGKLYKHPLWSAIREITANAIDAHVTSNIDSPIKIIVTNEYIMISDSGPGMSPTVFDTVYLDVGSSTKEQSTIDTGCMGVGSKSPHSVYKEFTIINHYNGTATESMLISQGMDDIEVVDIETRKTDRTGLDVIIPFRKGGYSANEAFSWAMVMKTWSRFVDIEIDNQAGTRYSHVVALNTYDFIGDNYYANEVSLTELTDTTLLVPSFFMKDPKEQERTLLARCGSIIYPVKLLDSAYVAIPDKSGYNHKKVYTLPNKSNTTLVVDIPKKHLPIVPSREELQMTPEFKELFLKKVVTISNRVRAKLDNISNKKATEGALENFYLYRTMLNPLCKGKKFDMNLFRMHKENRRTWMQCDHKDVWGDAYNLTFDNNISVLQSDVKQHSVDNKLRIGLLPTAKNSTGSISDAAEKRGEYLLTCYDVMAAKVDIILASPYVSHRNVDAAKKWLTRILGDKMDCVELFLVETADMSKADTVYDKIRISYISEYSQSKDFHGDPSKVVANIQEFLDTHRVYLSKTVHYALHGKKDMIRQLVEIMHGGRHNELRHRDDYKSIIVLDTNTVEKLVDFATKHNSTFDFSQCTEVGNLAHAGIDKLGNQDWIDAKKVFYTWILHKEFNAKAQKINQSFSKISGKEVHKFPNPSVDLYFHGNVGYELRNEAIEVLGLAEEVRAVERLERHPMVTLLGKLSNSYSYDNDPAIANALAELYTEHQELFDDMFEKHDIKHFR
ncbi:histidine kinase-like ATPase [Vibrio phage 2.275.O._10N.286.54.E11]|nr:histidine kinase-like ATPase [Vibrio phage 2.275.O._10N.286.54.E11]